jgi:hypothetical protein
MRSMYCLWSYTQHRISTRNIMEFASLYIKCESKLLLIYIIDTITYLLSKICYSWPKHDVAQSCSERILELLCHLVIRQLLHHLVIRVIFVITKNSSISNYLLYLQIEVYHCEIKYITFVLLQVLPAEKHIM